MTREAPPAVVALLAEPAAGRDLAAGFEEEGVPLRIAAAAGGRIELARLAARDSPLGLGIGGDAGGLALVLGAAPAAAYLDRPLGEARRFGHEAARLAARRPLRARGGDVVT